MSEIKFDINENVDKNVREAAEELKRVGLGAFADCYYKEDGFNCPFFKIEKPFKKEKDDDPDNEILYLDVDDEYTVHTRLGHEHYGNCKDAVNTIKGLYDGSLAEIALCFPDLTIRVLINNTFNPEKNIAIIDDNIKLLMEQVRNYLPKMAGNVHSHIAFSPTFPHYIQIMHSKNHVYENSNAFLQSIVFGEYPEIFVV